MSARLDQLDRFAARWREQITQQAGLRFEARALDNPSLLHTALADELMQSLGLKPIGQNWEMLDPEALSNGPRSALAAFRDALSHHMAIPKQQWLGEQQAIQCGKEFLACFAPKSRTILTNRMDFGWNPVSDAAIEWAFVGFDDSQIALILLTAET